MPASTPCDDVLVKLAHALILVTVVAITLAGCGLGPNPSPSAGVPTSTPTDSPGAAAQARETGLTRPAQVFGGECERLFTTAELSDLLGVQMKASPWSPLRASAVEQHGGISCTWRDDASTLVAVEALPEGALDYSGTTGCDVNWPDNLGAGIGCALEATKNGVVLSGAVFGVAGVDAPVAAQTELLRLFSLRVEGENIVPLPVQAEGAWALPADCGALVAAGDFSAVPGLGASVEGWDAGFGDAYYVPVGVALNGGQLLPCGVTSGDVTVNFSWLGGGRWVEDEVEALPGATTLAVEGIDSVILSPAYESSTRVDVFTGPNWLSFNVRFTKNAGVLTQALVAALDTTAIE